MRSYPCVLLLALASFTCSSGVDGSLPPEATRPDLSVEPLDSPLPEDVDRNQNGQVCRKIPASGVKKFPSFIYVDDSPGQTPTCPPGFETAGVAG